MKTKAEILEACAIVAPSIHIQTLWTRDDDARWDIEDPEINPDDYNPWQSEVRASCIHNGQMISGEAHLGGTWEHFGENPEKSNPEISGYFPQMLTEALTDLMGQLGKTENYARLTIQCQAALATID